MKLFQTAIVLLFTSLTFGQGNPDVREQADLLAKALLKDDYVTVLRFTYPKIVEMVGGSERMINLIKQGKDQMAQQGVGFDTVEIGEPSKIVTAGEEIHCLISQTIFLKVPKGRMKTESYLLAVSKDQGNHWFFIDAVNLTLDNVKSIVPNYNSDLKIPEKKQPQFIPD
jgi:hypothetical protein